MSSLREAPPIEDTGKPFLEHLEDLRRTILRCFLALAAGMLVALPLAPRILGLLRRPLAQVVEDPERFLRSLDVAGGFAVALRITLWSGVLLSAPLLVYFAASFVAPGLTRREREVFARGGFFAAGLFALGVFVGYRFTLPVALQAMFRLHTWMGIVPEWTVTSYTTFALQLLIGFGLAFQLPVVVLLLGRLGLLTSRQLRAWRRHAVIVLLLLAMVLTPPDIFTQLMMALPLILLYELCIWLVYLYENKATGGHNQRDPS